MIARFKKIAQILVAKWEDELVIFNPNSGDTHLFPVMLEPIIRYCSKHDDFSLSELLSGLDLVINDTHSSNASESIVEEGVNQLVNIGFLQPVTCD